MLTREDILAFLQTQKAELFSRYRLVKLGVFGSFARNEQTAESDIDVLVEFLPDTEDLSGKKLEIKNLINQQFDREVDICREKYVKPYFKSQILANAVYV
jgi:predicted nucleotidyltransferase